MFGKASEQVTASHMALRLGGDEVHNRLPTETGVLDRAMPCEVIS